MLSISAPYAENDFEPANGGAVFSFPEDITCIKKFRQTLYIFGSKFIRKLTGFGVSTYKLEHVTDSVGCIASRSIQEIAGDLLFLAADGLRTVAGTDKIDDVELGTISRAVQPLMTASNLPVPETDYICSAVVRNKSQYRLFVPVASYDTDRTQGVIAVITDSGWEFSSMLGIRPVCSTDAVLDSDRSQVIHGDENGFIFKQEDGKLFDDISIPFLFHTPELMLGDPGIRNEFHRVILNLDQEGRSKFNMNLLYNFEDAESPQPETYMFSEGSSLDVFGPASLFGTVLFSVEPKGFIRQPVEGSGFTASLKFTNDTALSAADSSDSFTFKGVQIEHINSGRR